MNSVLTYICTKKKINTKLTIYGIKMVHTYKYDSKRYYRLIKKIVVSLNLTKYKT